MRLRNLNPPPPVNALDMKLILAMTKSAYFTTMRVPRLNIRPK